MRHGYEVTFTRTVYVEVEEGENILERAVEIINDCSLEDDDNYFTEHDFLDMSLVMTEDNEGDQQWL